jgi:tetratricopeptide (TPR) repeat protein
VIDTITGALGASPVLFVLAMLAACGATAPPPPPPLPAPGEREAEPAAPAAAADAPEADPLDSAVTGYERRLAEHPRSYPLMAQLGGALLSRARSRGSLEDLDRASEILERSLSIQVNEEALRWLAGVRLDQHRFQEAAHLARQALEADEGDGIARAVLVDALLAMGRFDDARPIVEHGRAEDADFYSIAGYSRWLFLRGEVDGAVAQLERALGKLEGEGTALEVEAARAWCHLMIGSFKFDTGRPEEAVQHYDRALAINPHDPDAVEHRAEWEGEHGDEERAVRMYRESLERNPRTHEMVALGDLLVELGRPEEAAPLFTRAVEHWRARLAAGDISHRRDLAMFLLDHDRDLEEALELARQDLDTRRDPLTYDTLAWALFKNGELDEARDAMRTATAFGVTLSSITEHREAIDAAARTAGRGARGRGAAGPRRPRAR